MRIAIPKGRLQEKALGVFRAAGYDVPTEADLRTRKLVFKRGDVEWIFVKDCDVPVYVEHGAADAGIAGLDQILEHECTAYQPVEFPFGRCKMMLIAAPGGPPLTKVATKYPRITRQFLDARGIILVDFKLEFGRHKGEILLGDEICPDTCRFWDKATLKKLDKDRFRRDLGDVEGAYHEMLRRVSN